VITALAATSACLAFGLSAVELGMSPFRLALFGGALTAILFLYEMLTRDGVVKTAVTGVFVTVLIVILVLDVALISAVAQGAVGSSIRKGPGQLQYEKPRPAAGADGACLRWSASRRSWQP